jgi:hypothetical protein
MEQGRLPPPGFRQLPKNTDLNVAPRGWLVGDPQVPGLAALTHYVSPV